MIYSRRAARAFFGVSIEVIDLSTRRGFSLDHPKVGYLTITPRIRESIRKQRAAATWNALKQDIRKMPGVKLLRPEAAAIRAALGTR